MDTEVCFLSAVEMARMVRAKKISARELLEAHLQRIGRVNPKVNAIVTLVEERARAQAKAADEAAARRQWLGPLHGLPVAHKDLHETKGIRTTFGSLIFQDNVPSRDEIFIERMKQAGAIALGKTNTPEFGAGSQTFNRVFGATRNPYDLTRTCGGSSGGAAVALACGMTALADGSDMGGSLRNPASFCNVLGLRTAVGRVPTFSGWRNLSVAGPMARSAADAALLLSVMAGPDDRSPIALQESGQVFARPLERNFRGVRVAWAPRIAGMVFDPRVLAVVERQRKTLENLGCVVEDASPDFSGADEVFRTLRAWTFEMTYGGMDRQAMKDTVVQEIERGDKLTGPQLGHAEKLRIALYERVRVFLNQYEFMLLPAVQVPPFDVNLPYPAEIGGVKMESYIDWMRSCYYITTTGNPAASVPCGFTGQGLPVGLQIVGRQRAEFAVLQMAHAFEAATEFGKQRPPDTL